MPSNAPNEHQFPAKLLLFGEYTIINGGSALAIPYDKHHGQWQEGSKTSELGDFYSHLKNLEGCLPEKVVKAEKNNWYFKSDIPLGYGLGSSGAISAAAYAAFFREEDLALVALKNRLSEIESFFHGRSSGLDPLVCYTGMAVHINDGQINLLKPPQLPPQLTLYDSGIKRNGKPLIKYYLDRLEVDEAFDEVVVALDNFNERIISELLGGEDITASFKEISRLQLRHFQHMIPEKVLEHWQQGLETDSHYMKLAGAGGGGSFLLYTLS